MQAWALPYMGLTESSVPLFSDGKSLVSGPLTTKHTTFHFYLQIEGINTLNMSECLQCEYIQRYHKVTDDQATPVYMWRSGESSC